MRHVLVNGSFVVRDGALLPDALPGRGVRGARGAAESAAAAEERPAKKQRVSGSALYATLLGAQDTSFLSGSS